MNLRKQKQNPKCIFTLTKYLFHFKLYILSDINFLNSSLLGLLKFENMIN